MTTTKKPLPALERATLDALARLERGASAGIVRWFDLESEIRGEAWHCLRRQRAFEKAFRALVARGLIDEPSPNMIRTSERARGLLMPAVRPLCAQR